MKHKQAHIKTILSFVGAGIIVYLGMAFPVALSVIFITLALIAIYLALYQLFKN